MQNAAQYSLIVFTTLSVDLLGSPYITVNREKVSTRMRQYACEVLAVRQGELLQCKISINTVALGWLAGVCGCLFLLAIQIVAI